MKKKKIILNKKIKEKFKMKPLFDDSDMYEEKSVIHSDTPYEELDSEIEELVKKIKSRW